MGKRCVGMLLKKGFNLLPITGVVANILTVRAYGYQATQSLDLFKGLLKVHNKLLFFFVGDFPTICQKNKDDKEGEPDTGIPNWD